MYSAPRDRVPLGTPIIVLEHLPFRFPRAERLFFPSEPGAPPHSPSAPGILVTIIEFASGITDCGSSVEGVAHGDSMGSLMGSAGAPPPEGRRGRLCSAGAARGGGAGTWNCCGGGSAKGCCGGGSVWEGGASANVYCGASSCSGNPW